MGGAKGQILLAISGPCAISHDGGDVAIQGSRPHLFSVKSVYRVSIIVAAAPCVPCGFVGKCGRIGRRESRAVSSAHLLSGVLRARARVCVVAYLQGVVDQGLRDQEASLVEELLQLLPVV